MRQEWKDNDAIRVLKLFDDDDQYIADVEYEVNPDYIFVAWINSARPGGGTALLDALWDRYGLPFESAEEHENTELGNAFLDRYRAKHPNRIAVYDSVIEYVPTDWVAQFREFTRDIDTARYTELRDDIAENGILEPLLLEVSVRDSRALLTEGNHRLRAAEELGIDEVPVRVLTRRNLGDRGVPVEIEEGIGDGWDLKPSQALVRVGASTYYHVSTADLSPGDLITPSGGRSPFEGMTDPQYAYACDETYLDHWEFEIKDWAEGFIAETPVYTYQVEPTGEVIPDPIMEIDGNYATSDGWRVIDKRRIAAKYHPLFGEHVRAYDRKLPGENTQLWMKMNPSLTGAIKYVFNVVDPTLEERGDDYRGMLEVYLVPEGTHAVITNVWVIDKRQGIATALLEIAREVVPVEIQHNDELTDDGRAWSEAVGRVAQPIDYGNAPSQPNQGSAYPQGTYDIQMVDDEDGHTIKWVRVVTETVTYHDDLMEMALAKISEQKRERANVGRIHKVSYNQAPAILAEQRIRERGLAGDVASSVDELIDYLSSLLPGYDIDEINRRGTKAAEEGMTDLSELLESWGRPGLVIQENPALAQGSGGDSDAYAQVSDINAPGADGLLLFHYGDLSEMDELLLIHEAAHVLDDDRFSNGHGKFWSEKYKELVREHLPDGAYNLLSFMLGVKFADWSQKEMEHPLFDIEYDDLAGVHRASDEIIRWAGDEYGLSEDDVWDLMPIEDIPSYDLIPTQSWLRPQKFDMGPGGSEGEGASRARVTRMNGVNYLLDGHHRHYERMIGDPAQPIECRVFDVGNAKEIIESQMLVAASVIMRLASPHALERVNERLTDAGYDDKFINKIWHVIQSLKTKLNKDTAVRILRLPGMVNDYWGDRSNGNELWAIYRGGDVRTVMLRRDTQPNDPEAFRVDQVFFLQPGVFNVVTSKCASYLVEAYTSDDVWWDTSEFTERDEGYLLWT